MTDCTHSPPLIADAMLGGLARWLRILGFDVAHDPALHDRALVARARGEGRLLLTRDRKLVERKLARPYHLVAAERIPEQIQEVLAALGLTPDPARFLSRCLRCNRPLEPLAPQAARLRVPPFVARTQTRFRRCPDCEGIFWSGSHAERMRRRLESWGIATGAHT